MTDLLVLGNLCPHPVITSVICKKNTAKKIKQMLVNMI